VAQNPWSRLRKRIDLRGSIVICGHPPHYAEASDLIDVEGFQAIKAEVFEVDPRAAVFVA
jgi:hypothetical protein